MAVWVNEFAQILKLVLFAKTAGCGLNQIGKKGVAGVVGVVAGGTVQCSAMVRVRRACVAYHLERK